MLSLAGQRPPAGGAWLWVTVADARRAVSSPPCSCRGPGHARTAGMCCSASPPAPQAEEHWPGPAARVQVQAVVAGSLIHVAGWDHLSLDLWPEAVRATAAFAMGALRELQEQAPMSAHATRLTWRRQPSRRRVPRPAGMGDGRRGGAGPGRAGWGWTGSRAGRGVSGPGPGGRCRRRSSRGRPGARRRPGRCGPSGGREDGSRSRGASPPPTGAGPRSTGRRRRLPGGRHDH